MIANKQWCSIRVDGVERWLRVVFPATSSCFVALWLMTPLASAAQDRLILEEEYTIRLNGSFAARGGGFVGSAVYAWSETELVIGDTEAIITIRFLPELHPVGIRVGKFGSDYRIELVDGNAIEIQTYDSAMQLLAQRSVQFGGSWIPLAAVAHGQGWFIQLGDTTADAQRVLLVGPEGETEVLPAMNIDLADSADASSDPVVRLSSSGGRSFACELVAPFRSWEISSANRPRQVFSGIVDWAHSIAGLRRFSLDSTFCLGTWPAEDALVQLIGDSSGDQRLLILSDLRGDLMRATIINAAIGILATDSKERRLLAVRDVGSKDLVVYRWRWDAGTQPRR